MNSFNEISVFFNDAKTDYELLNDKIEQDYSKLIIPQMTTGIFDGLSFSAERFIEKLRYEVDIFSDLPDKVFDDKHNQQMASTLKVFRRSYNSFISKDQRTEIIPKLEYILNEDEKSEVIRLFSEWEEGNGLLYFSFEAIPEESNYGIIWNDNKAKKYQAKSGILFRDNIHEIVEEAMSFIFGQQ